MNKFFNYLLFISKLKKIRFFVYILIFSLTTINIISAEQIKTNKELSTWDDFSVKVYCYFNSCEDTTQNNNEIKKINSGQLKKERENQKQDQEEQKEELKNIVIKEITQQPIDNTKIINNTEVIDRTKYIDRTITKEKLIEQKNINYYNTYPVKEIQNNIENTKIIREEVGVPDEIINNIKNNYETANNNTELINNLTETINNINNINNNNNSLNIDNLNDIGNVDADPRDNQILGWDESLGKWVARNDHRGGGSHNTDQQKIDNFNFSGDIISISLENDNESDKTVDLSKYIDDSESIDLLNDVDTSTIAPTSGQILSWNGVNWVPDDISVGTTYSAGNGLNLSGTVFSLSSGIDLLNDVDTSTNTPASGQILSWNGINWIPSDNLLKSFWDDDSDTGIQVEETIDEDNIRFDTGGNQRMQIDNNGNILFSDSEPADLLNPGTINGFLYKKDKFALRTGSTSNQEWDDNNVGIGTFSSGQNNVVIGNYSSAMGGNNNVTDVYSTALGRRNTVSGSYSIATGVDNISSGYASGVFGQNNQVTGRRAMTWGIDNIATQDEATSWGRDTEANANYATSFGWDTNANGELSTAFGYQNNAQEQYSTAFGYQNNALGRYSTVWGGQNQVQGQYGTSWGSHNTASGDHSTTFGSHNTASGRNSTAIGYYSEASGNDSFATGDTLANSYFMTSVGRFNENISGQNLSGWEDSDQLFVVGNGTDWHDANRSNALTILKNGTITAPTFSLAEINNAGDTALTTKEYVDSEVIAHNGIYTSDGLVTSDRIVTFSGSDLSFVSDDDDGEFEIDVKNAFGDENGYFSVEPYAIDIGTQNGAPAQAYIGIDPVEIRIHESNINYDALVNVGNTGVVLNYRDTPGEDNRFEMDGDIVITDNANNRGVVYDADYSANYTDRSLVDKEYVDYQMQWEIVGDMIRPKNNAVKRVYVENNSDGYTQFKVRNNDDTGTLAGALIELKGSGADYTNNMYIGKYGDSFWIPELASNGAVMTDKNLIIGTASDSHEIHFVTGDSYVDLKPVVVADNQGFRYTSDLSATYVDRTLVDKEYVDDAIVSNAPTLYIANGTLSGDRTVTSNGNALNFTGVNNSFKFQATDGVNNNTFIDIIDDEIIIDSDDPSGDSSMIFNPTVLSFYTSFNGTGSEGLDFIDSGIIFTDNHHSRGVVYAADYSANFTNRSLVDKEYVDDAIVANAPTIYNTDGTLTGDRSVNGDGNRMIFQGERMFGVAAGDFPGDYARLEMDNSKSVLSWVDAANTDSSSGLELTTDYAKLYGNDEMEITIEDTGMIVRDDTNTRGFMYESNYSANFVDRSLVDKEYVDDAIVANAPTLYISNGTLSGDRTVTSNGNALNFTGVNNSFEFKSTDGVNNDTYIDISDDEIVVATTDGTDSSGLLFNPGIVRFEASFGGAGMEELGFEDSGIVFTDTHHNRGAIYGADYSTNFVDRSLVDKEYVDDTVAAGNIYGANGTISEHRTVTFNDNALDFLAVGDNSEYNVDLTDSAGMNSYIGMLPGEIEFNSSNAPNGSNMVIGIDKLSFNYANALGEQNYFSVGEDIEIKDEINNRGIIYNDDYSTNFVDRSLVDKEYVDDAIDNNITVSNGLTEISNNIQLGGNLINDTIVNGVATYDLSIADIDRFEVSHGTIGASDWYFSIVDGTGSSFGVANTIMKESSIKINPSEMKVIDRLRGTGLIYDNDYSTNFVDRSLVDKGYVDSLKYTMQDIDNDTKIQVEETNDEDMIRFDIGDSSGVAYPNAMVINSNSNVGIGVVDPTLFKLELAGDLGPTANDVYDLGSSTRRWQDLYLGPNTLHIGSDGDESQMSFNTANNLLTFQNTADSATGFQFLDADGGTPILNIDTTNERIGIGTDTPEWTVDVQENLSGSLKGMRIYNPATDGMASIQVRAGSGSNNNGGIGVRAENAAAYGVVAPTDAYLYSNLSLALMANRNTGIIKFATGGNSEKMRLDSDGNLGIGTINPSSILHIDSNDVNENALLTLENTGGDMQIFRVDATPEGTVTASIGDLAFDSTNGEVYLKNTSNGTNTGWIRMLRTGDNFGIADQDNNTWIRTETSPGSDENVIVAQANNAGATDPIQIWKDNAGSTVGQVNANGELVINNINGDWIRNMINSRSQIITTDRMVAVNFSPGDGSNIGLTADTPPGGTRGGITLDSLYGRVAFTLNNGQVQHQMRVWANDSGYDYNANNVNHPFFGDLGTVNIFRAGVVNHGVLSSDAIGIGDAAEADIPDAMLGIYATTANGSNILKIEDSSNTTKFLVQDNGNLTTYGSSIFNEDGADNDFRIEGDTDANLLFADAGNDRIGIGTNTPAAQLHTTGTIRFSGLGAGTLQTDANGNVSVSSDESLKNIDKKGFERSIDSLLNIKPIKYKWKEETGFDTENYYYGFSAQNIKDNIPEAVGEYKKLLTLSDRPILAVVINAIKEIWEKIMDNSDEINKLKEENKTLKEELCERDNTYSWCGYSKKQRKEPVIKIEDNNEEKKKDEKNSDENKDDKEKLLSGKLIDNGKKEEKEKNKKEDTKLDKVIINNKNKDEKTKNEKENNEKILVEESVNNEKKEKKPIKERKLNNDFKKHDKNNYKKNNKKIEKNDETKKTINVLEPLVTKNNLKENLKSKKNDILHKDNTKKKIKVENDKTPVEKENLNGSKINNQEIKLEESPDNDNILTIKNKS